MRVFGIVVLITISVFATTASADSAVMKWGANTTIGDFAPTPQQACVNIDNWTLYDGDKFTFLEEDSSRPPEEPVNRYICHDANGEAESIWGRCWIYDDQGNHIRSIQYVGSCSDPAAMCPIGAGNPTEISTLAKVEIARDWTSPLDSRFTFFRTYRSDERLVSRASGAYHAEALGGVWRLNFDEVIRYNEPTIIDYSYSVHTHSGNILLFDAASFAPASADHAFSLSEVSPADNRLRFAGPNGTIKYFSPIGSNEYQLTSVVWPDGYKITVELDDNDRIMNIFDNRQQRAEVTWSSAEVENLPVPLISSIEIDSNFDGSVLSSNISISYEYLQNDFTAFNPVVSKVQLTDLGTFQIVEDREYEYVISQYASPPKLISIRDGRIDSGAQPFDYAEFSYATDYRGIYTKVETTQHFGGAEMYEFEASSGNGFVTVTNPLSKETIYTFDTVAGSRRLTGVEGVSTTNCLPSDTSVTLDANAYVIERLERNGSVTQFTRDSDGRILTRTEDANGLDPRVTTYTWHATFRKPLTRTTDDLQESFTYDADGLLTSYGQEDILAGSPNFGETRTWMYTYTTLASGLKVLTEIDGPGDAVDNIDDETTFLYDAQGRLTQVTDPNNLQTVVQSFDVTGLPSLITDQQGFDWGFEYDINGRLLSSTFEPSGAAEITTFTYDIVGQLVSSTDSLGRTWGYTYNEARRLIEIESPSGDTISFDHDAMGNVTRTEYTDQAAVLRFLEEAQYDELGRILQVLGSNGQTMGFSHDVEDNLATTTDATSLTTTNTYDALNRITDVVDRAAYTTTMGHNDANDVVSYTDPRGTATTFTYNGFGEVVQEVSADRGTMSYEYDSRGLVTSFTDANGQEREYRYDDGSRLTVIRFPGASAFNQYFYYHSNNYHAGTLKRAFDQSGETRQYAEATRGNIDRDWRTIEDVQYRIKYRTDEEGQFEQVLYPSGGILRLYYDQDGNLSDVGWQGVDPVTGNVISPMIRAADEMTYLPFGPLDYMEYPDGSIHTASYDSSYRLTGLLDTLGTTTLRDVSYGWTTRDNLASVTDNLLPAQDEVFGYSAREFLASATGAWGEFDYTYDGVGNRTSFTEVIASTPITQDYNYPLSSNRLESLSAGGTTQRSLAYDNAGNVIADTQGSNVYTYTYDAANRMASVSLNGVEQANYEYNFLGQQVIRRLASGDTIHSVHDIWGNRIAEYDYDDVAGTSSLIREYLWAGDRLIGVWENGSYYAVRVDHIGRPIFATDMSGTVVWDATYLPFGGVQTSAGPNLDLRFPGQWFQAEAGLHQNWMRDYDPTLGRYLQADPLGLVDGASVYGYALQNPGRYTDPRGEDVAALLSPGVWLRAGAMCGVDGPVPIGEAMAILFILSVLIAEDECEGCTAPPPPKQQCIEICTELALPTSDYGASFFQCMAACESNGNSGFPNWDRYFP